jgi:hypothetical protein
VRRFINDEVLFKVTAFALNRTCCITGFHTTKPVFLLELVQKLQEKLSKLVIRLPILKVGDKVTPFLLIHPNMVCKGNMLWCQTIYLNSEKHLTEEACSIWMQYSTLFHVGSVKKAIMFLFQQSQVLPDMVVLNWQRYWSNRHRFYKNFCKKRT